MKHELIPYGGAFRLAVDYDRTIATAIKAGNYHYANPRITGANFPASADESGTREVELRLLSSKNQIDSNEAMRAIRELGIRPATLREILVLGQTDPGLQTQFMLPALGSRLVSLNGSFDVSVLFRDETGRYIDLFYLNRWWSDKTLFLVVSE